jgi:flagellar M-ring protein FliF
MADETQNPKTFLQQLADMWASMTKERQATLGGVALIAIIVFATLIGSGGLDGNWTPLTRGLSPEDQQAAIIALDAKSIPYRLGDFGTLEVKEDHLHDARLELAVSSMPSGRNIGFELFDKSELGRSAFAEKVNFHRALEGELERTIRHLDPVERARVHLVMPSRALFEEQQADPSASVVVTLRNGRNLSKGQVKAIRHLISAAVERLGPGQVAVIDETGAMLARPEDEESGLDGAFEHQAAWNARWKNESYNSWSPSWESGEFERKCPLEWTFLVYLKPKRNLTPTSKSHEARESKPRTIKVKQLLQLEPLAS